MQPNFLELTLGVRFPNHRITRFPGFLRVSVPLSKMQPGATKFFHPRGSSAVKARQKTSPGRSRGAQCALRD
jgi:hypothetical protein